MPVVAKCAKPFLSSLIAVRGCCTLTLNARSESMPVGLRAETGKVGTRSVIPHVVALPMWGTNTGTGQNKRELHTIANATRKHLYQQHGDVILLPRTASPALYDPEMDEIK